MEYSVCPDFADGMGFSLDTTEANSKNDDDCKEKDYIGIEGKVSIMYHVIRMTCFLAGLRNCDTFYSRDMFECDVLFQAAPLYVAGLVSTPPR